MIRPSQKLQLQRLWNKLTPKTVDCVLIAVRASSHLLASDAVHFCYILTKAHQIWDRFRNLVPRMLLWSGNEARSGLFHQPDGHHERSSLPESGGCRDERSERGGGWPASRPRDSGAQTQTASPSSPSDPRSLPTHGHCPAPHAHNTTAGNLCIAGMCACADVWRSDESHKFRAHFLIVFSSGASAAHNAGILP